MDTVLAFFVKTTAEIQAKEASFRALFCTSPMLHLLTFNKGLGTGFCVDAPVSHKGQQKAKQGKNSTLHNHHTAHLHRTVSLASYLDINVLGNRSITLPLTHFGVLCKGSWKKSFE